MKKINKNGIRALIMETLEEISLGEAKKVEEMEEPSVDPGDETAAAGRGAGGLDHSDEEVESMNTPEVQKEKAKIVRAFEFYQSEDDLPILISTIETSLKFLESLLPPEAGQAPNSTQVK